MATTQLPSPPPSRDGDAPQQRRSNDDYILGRSHAANARLNLQHYLWREILGYSVHPAIPWNKPDVRIADIGSGTSQWLLELADQLPPTATLHGYDLDHSQAMPTGWHPSTVSLHKWDATADSPIEEYYDVIQIRLFIFVVKGNDPSSILRNLLKMLKPGGYIQWLEPDFQTLHFATTDPSRPAKHLPTLEAATTSSDPRLQPTWVSSLSSHFSTAGMRDVIEERKYGPRHTWYAYNSCVLMAREEVIAQKVRDGNMSVDRAEELRKMVTLAAEEARGGASYVIERVCVVGRKDGHVEGSIGNKIANDKAEKPWYQRSIGDLLGALGRRTGLKGA